MHPNRKFVATGQVASAMDGSFDAAYVCIWDAVAQPIKEMWRMELHDARYIVALSFSPCGNRLAVVTGDNKHTIYIYKWRTKELVFTGLGHTGRPPQVRMTAAKCSAANALP